MITASTCWIRTSRWPESPPPAAGQDRATATTIRSRSRWTWAGADADQGENGHSEYPRTLLDCGVLALAYRLFAARRPPRAAFCPFSMPTEQAHHERSPRRRFCGVDDRHLDGAHGGCGLRPRLAVRRSGPAGLRGRIHGPFPGTLACLHTL